MESIFIDFETTGVSAHNDYIIEGYFLKESGEDYEYKQRPYIWKEEAEAIHGISRVKASKYPEPKDAIPKLLKWLPKEFRFICYANPNTPEGNLHYDSAILLNQIHLLAIVNGLDSLYWDYISRKIQIISVYSMVQQALNDKLISMVNLVEPEKKRLSKSMENVAANLGISYNAHNAKSDVKTTKLIYDHILSLYRGSYGIDDRAACLNSTILDYS